MGTGAEMTSPNYVDGYGLMTPWRSSWGLSWVPKWRQVAGRTICRAIGHDESRSHPRAIQCTRCWSDRVKT